MQRQYFIKCCINVLMLPVVSHVLTSPYCLCEVAVAKVSAENDTFLHHREC